MSWKPAVALAVMCLGPLTGTAAQAANLSDAQSPYLLSHADDAIDWHPWREDVLKRARRENKLIFLSIGYASCHWCHVMARTTFSDPRVVEALNDNYISILVDSEQRPDLDNYFMKIMSAMIGTSGAPANFFLTPDLVPVFAGGFLAAEPKYGDPGFLDVAKSIAREKARNPTGFAMDVDITRSQLREMWRIPRAGAARGGKDPRAVAEREWLKRFDREYGGFGDQPKFPMPNVLLFLLERGVRRGDDVALSKVYRTLDHMAAGGVRDQLGGAFHRYAVDRFWQVPHFEIMLADNAALARLYLSAYRASGRRRYAVVAREVLDDLLARFRLPGGGFATAFDAESEGIEGRFYTWTSDDVLSVLGPREGPSFLATYLDGARGSVRGRAVLRLKGAPAQLVATQDRLSQSRWRLLEARRKRPPPTRDDKVLTSWNALAVSAFAKAARVFSDARYLKVARLGIEQLLSARTKGGGLTHSRWKGRASDDVFLDDYAFLIQALLDLYEADFRVTHLDRARGLTRTLIKRFQAQPGRPFRMTPLDRPSPIPSQIILDESGLPSGNAAALIALHRLVLYGAEADFENETRAVVASLGRYLEESAAVATGLLRALEFRPNEAHEIMVVGGRDHHGTRSLLREVHARVLPGTVLAVIPPDSPMTNEAWPLLSARPMIDGKPTAYVCQKRLCQLPVNSPRELSAQLDRLFTQNKRNPD